MSNENSEKGVVLCICIGLLAGLLIGHWFGVNSTELPEEIYVFESQQPIRAVFDKELPQSIETESFTTTKGDHEYIFYYWIERAPSDGVWMDGSELHWTWREVIGP